MAEDLRLKRSKDRWYPLIDHPVQSALVNEDVRFKVVPSGRRSGKTERAKRFLARLAMQKSDEVYFAAAPTRDQAKKIWWNDLKLLTFANIHQKKPSESNLIIYMPNGTEIHVLGLDVAARIEGVFWSGGIIDEIANIKDDSWALNIKPALDTFNPSRPDYRAWCWLIGVPEGIVGDFYNLYEYAMSANDVDWKVYTWFSADILPDDVIQSAKRTMSLKQYKQEYEGSFETAAGRIYEDYSKDNHTDRTIQPHEQLLWMHDQNYTPLSSAVGVRDGDKIYLLEEIVLTSATSRQSAMEFVERYKHHKNKHVIIYGDPSGRNGEKHGHSSDYTDMEEVLRLHHWKYTRRIRRAHPAIKDRQNCVRAKIKTASGDVSLFVNVKNASWCHKGLATVQLQKGSTFQEDQKNQYQHITTAIGYMIEYEWSLQNIVMVTGIHSAN